MDGSLLGLGLDFIEWGILIVSMAILITVSALDYKIEKKNESLKAGEEPAGSVRDYIFSRPIALRWCIIIALLFYCILLANYGPGYSAAEFIYKDF